MESGPSMLRRRFVLWRFRKRCLTLGKQLPSASSFDVAVFLLSWVVTHLESSFISLKIKFQ